MARVKWRLCRVGMADDVPISSLSNANPGWPDDCQSAPKVQSEQVRKPLTNERQNNTPSGANRTEQNNSGLLLYRILLKIRDALVQRKQDSILRRDDCYQNRVLCARKTFIEHGIRLVARIT